MTESVSEPSASFVQSVRSVVKSDRGLVLETNEDAFSIIRSSESRGFFVADGMGGPSKGEIASHLALSTLESLLRSKKQFLESDVRTAIEKANEAIVELAESGPHFWGMGTTVSGIVFGEDTAFIAHVGNSRIYRLRNRKLTQLTKDHQKEDVQNKHLVSDGVVSAVLGESKALTIDLFALPEPPRDGDRYLCCTDGVYNAVELDELCDILEGAPLEDTAKEIIALVRGRGGKDNITALVVQIGEKPSRLVEPSAFVESVSPESVSAQVPAQEVEVYHGVEEFEDKQSDKQPDNFDEANQSLLTESSEVTEEDSILDPDDFLKSILEEDSVVGDLQNVERLSEIDESGKVKKKKKKGKKFSRRSSKIKFRNNASRLKTVKNTDEQGFKQPDDLENSDIRASSNENISYQASASDSDQNENGSYRGIQSVAAGYEGRNLKPLRIFSALCIGFLIGVAIQIGIKLFRPHESDNISGVVGGPASQMAQNETDESVISSPIEDDKNDDAQTSENTVEDIAQDSSLDERADILSGGHQPVSNNAPKLKEEKNLSRRVVVLRTETIEEIQAGAQQSLVASLKQRDIAGTSLDSVQLVSSIDRLNNPRVRRIMVEVVGAIEESVNETDRRLMALAEQQDKTNQLLVELIRKLSDREILKISDGLANKEP